MPTSYTSSLRAALPATGENTGTWGALVNNSITQILEDAITGYVSVAMTDADYTLTTANGSTDQSRNMFVNMTGTLTAARNVICPTAEKLYFFKNSTTGGYALTLKTSGGTGISVPNGKAVVLMCDGTNVIDATSHMSSLTLTTALAAGSGGTGLTSPGTSGNVLTSNGTAWVSSPSAGGAVVAMQTFTSSGTYTPTAGMDYCIVHMVGGGAGGIQASSGNYGGAGGGAGEYATGVFSAATVGASQAVTIGAGGAVNTGGGTTSLGALLTAPGGATGTGVYIGGLGGSGGTGTGLHVPGGDGGMGGGVYSGPQIYGGHGGASFFGGGGYPGVGGLINATAGRAYGSGGGGNGFVGGSWSLAGAGAGGCVIVYEFV